MVKGQRRLPETGATTAQDIYMVFIVYIMVNTFDREYKWRPKCLRIKMVCFSNSVCYLEFRFAI